MIEFGTQTLNPEKQVVNPNYRQLTHKLKKLREKISRIEAKFYPLAEQVMEQPIDQLPAITHKQAECKITLDQLKKEEISLIEKRKQCPPRIKLRHMPDDKRYNQLKTESKLLMNVIKMICYRAESTVASLIAPHLGRADEEKRMFLKQIIQNNADLIPDYKNNTLTITLHSLSVPRFNQAAKKLCELLN